VAVAGGSGVGVSTGGEESAPEQAIETSKMMIANVRNLYLRVISRSEITEHKFEFGQGKF
jgi:hypothetical protein